MFKPAARFFSAGRPAVDGKPAFIAADPTVTARAWIVTNKTSAGFEVGNATVVVHESYPATEDPDGEGSTFAYVFEPGDKSNPFDAHFASTKARAWLKAKGYQAA